MEILLRTLRQAHPDDAPPGGRRYLPDSPYAAGLETRTPADQYLWDGLKRGDSDRPFVVFQVTLDGWGVYEEGGAAHRVGPGRAFAALVPGPHRYYLPADSPHWTFFWLVIRHPYVVARMAERQRAAGTALLDVTEGSILIARAAALFTGFPDRFAEEEALLTFLVAYDRHVALASEVAGGTGPERERLLEESRRFVLERLRRPVDVAELAGAHGMDRSRFSHHFKTVTGATPAHHMARVRLEEVARRLVQTDATLARIADETGFADANHLCKAFRRHFRLSPGAFRRQMR
jgi:AraC-like DNA-binding protein